ncbi:Gliding motility-associated, C-terminal domain [Flavobacteriaceae bacterium]
MILDFKKIIYFSLIMSLLAISNCYSQSSSHFIALDNNGNLYDVNPVNCSYTTLNICGNIPNPLSIALSGSVLYIVDSAGKLWKQPYNGSGNCTLIGTFSNTSGDYFGLTVDASGIVYAVAGGKIETYNPTTNSFAVIGTLPSQWVVGGDILFYGGQLYMACRNLNLIAINLTNLAATTVYLSFNSGSNVFGFSSVSVPCSNNQAYAIDSILSGNSTNLLSLNMSTGSVGGIVCSLPFKVYDTASIAENGSYLAPPAPLVSSVTQPTCFTPTGNVVLSGLPSGNWTINPGGITGSTTSTTLFGLTTGTTNYTVTNALGCVSSATANVSINAPLTIPSPPTIGTITQPTCLTSTGSVILSGLPSGNWIINPGGITGSTTSTTLSSLTTGTTNYTVTNAAGCISLASANVLINVQPSAPTAPTLGTITQPTCLISTGSVVLNGLPSGNWTINPIGITGSTASTTITGLTSGTTNYTVTNTAGCISLASANVLINVQPSAPTAPTLGTITQPTCLISTGSVILNGLPTGNWTINPGGISGSTATTTISGLTSGTINYTVTNSDTCVSSLSGNITINAPLTIPTAPIVGTITQPTCSIPTGSVVLNGLPTGNWTINPVGISGSTVSTTITGLTTGTTNYTVTNSDTCVSSLSGNITINAPLTIPTAPIIGTITQPTCSIPTGSVVLNGLPTGNWTINPGGISGSTVSTTITGLTTGTTNYTVTNSDTCVSSLSGNITINAPLTIPTAPIVGTITQPTCSIPTGSVVLNGLPTGNWTINPGGISGSTATTTISGLTSGTINYTVTNSDTCISPASLNVLILTALTAAAPIFTPIPPICYGTIISLPINSTNGVSGTWSPLFDPTTTITYTFTPDPGQCSSTTTLQVTVLPTPTAIATPTTEIICSLQSTGIVLSGSIAGTTFSWVPSTTTVSGAVSDSGTIISQVLTATNTNVGSVVYVITPSYNGCSGTPISVSIFVTPKPVLSVSPALQTICSGTSTAIVLSSSMLNTNYSWNVIGTNVSGDLAGTGPIISQILTVGTTSGNAVYSIVPNVNGCLGAPIEVTVTVNPIPTLTINPVLGQTICSGETTAISLSSSVTNTTFSWAAIQNNINGSGPGNGNTIAQTLSTIIPALGTVTYTITPVSNGCIGASGSVSVNVKPTPEIFGIPSQLPICSGDSTNIVITPTLIGTTFSWTVNPIGVSGATNGSGSSIIQALETTGNTFGTVVYSLTPTLNLCSGLPIDIPVKVNPLPLPTLTAGVICVDASGIAFQTYILDTGLSSTDYTFEWSINGVLQSGVGATFEALVAGNYSVIATNILTGCISIPTFSVVTPSFPATGLTAEVTSLYFSENGTITATVTGGNGTYLFALDDGALQTSNVFENVELGQHTVSVTDTNGCTNLLPVTLNTIGYPTYFTPNGDGIHDTWNIIGLENQPTAKVYVFDRYGKLIKQISTRSSGWDGTYNGNPMPSSDYWFTIDYLEPGTKEFIAHFSLKR